MQNVLPEFVLFNPKIHLLNSLNTYERRWMDPNLPLYNLFWTVNVGHAPSVKYRASVGRLPVQATAIIIN